MVFEKGTGATYQYTSDLARVRNENRTKHSRLSDFVTFFVCLMIVTIFVCLLVVTIFVCLLVFTIFVCLLVVTIFVCLLVVTIFVCMLVVTFFVCLLLYVPSKNVSLTRRSHHSQSRAVRCRYTLCTYGFWAGMELYCATPPVTRASGSRSPLQPRPF